MFGATPLFVPFLLLAQSEAASSASSCPADAKEKWSYRGSNGPMFWGLDYPDCYKNQQSPIEIYNEQAVKDENLAKLSMDNYDTPISKARIANNGHTIQLTPEDDVERSITIQGSTYELKQLHFHWGDVYNKGSEHIIDDVQYALEMHLVHINENDEIAVVGVMLQEQSEPNAELQTIVSALPKLLYKDTTTKMTSTLNLNNLVPENPASYYRYQGSLTTPGCAEGVTWSLLTKFMGVGKEQMTEFRKLYSAKQGEADEACKLSNNYRPAQPLYSREVYLSQ